MEPRGFKLKCRGKINVKGKGSMVTYFLLSKKTEEEKLQHQSSKLTAASSEDFDATEEFENCNVELLTQKRKSLCRQHNIFSSLTNKSVTSNVSELSMGGSFDESQDLVSSTEKTKLIGDDNQNHIISSSNSTIISPEVHQRSLKCDFKPNLSGHHTILKDSIESLEKLLKNDISLCDLNAAKFCVPTKCNLEGNPRIIVNIQNNPLDVNDSLLNSFTNAINATNDSDFRNSTNTLIGNELSALTSDLNNDQLTSTMKKNFSFGDRSCFMKLSKSLYPLRKENFHSLKIPNSKSMYSMSSKNQNGNVPLI